MSLIIVILIGLLIFYLSQINYRKIYLSLKVPGPFPLPFIGNALLFFNKSAPDIWKTCEKLQADYGSVIGIWVCSEYGILLSNPKDIEVILTSTKFIEKSETYRYLRPWLNEGLLLSTGAKWFQRRKILTPAFHFKVLEEYTKIFDRQSSVFVDILSGYKATDKVELFPLVGLCTLDVICEAAMGIELNAQRNSNSEYVKAVKTIGHIIHFRMTGSFIRSDLIFRFSHYYKQQVNALKILHGFTDSVIQARRQKLVAQRNETSMNDTTTATAGSTKIHTFLDILLQTRIDDKPLSNLDIREEVDTFMFEGHDTTKSAISFCLYSLAKYPDIQQKCFQEIKTIFGDDCTKSVSSSELNNLQYLDLVIKESLRMYPSVPLMGRLLVEEIKIGNYTFPKGASIGFSPIGLGRDPKVFQNPEKFWPERFLEANINEKIVFSYLPFSAGPRNCESIQNDVDGNVFVGIGQKFAMLEIKTLLSKVLRHFEISLAEDSQSEPVLIGELITTSESKINYHLKPRVY